MSPAEPEAGGGGLALSPGEPRATREEWEAAAAAVLRKARRLGPDDPDSAVWGALTHSTLDGVPVPPLGTPDALPGAISAARPLQPGGRDVRVELFGDDPVRVNREALADLDGGATSLWLHADGGTDLAAVLDGVLLDLAAVVLDPGDDVLDAAQAFLGVLGDTEPAAGTSLGAPAHADDEVLVEVARLARAAGTLAVTIDASAVHDRGASEAQELGWSMAAGVRVLRVLDAAGVAPEEAAGLLEFRYAATDEQFVTIAKLRAARRLWLRVLALCEAPAVPQRQHAVTSAPMMSKYDPWVNMLRTTVAAFSATAGGADAVTVRSFDAPLGRPDAFGRRIARNQMALLLSESHVGQVTDPAGGAWAVERLTDDLAQAGWSVLQDVDAGADLDAAIADTVARRDQEVATRRRTITGLTEFPSRDEALPSRDPGPETVEVRRYGAAFEALRDRPASTPVFLATMGSVAEHTARATFASNLLAAGGIEVQSAGATDGVDDVLATYAGQQAVCLAGSDAAYADWGSDLVARLREAGARHVIVAGRPADLGVDDSCVLGVDALAFLTRTREVLG